MTKDEFIKKAESIHGDKYSYDKVQITKTSDKIIITCPKHGDFIQQANSHLQGRGCSKCSGKKFCLEDFIERANKVWNNKYDYSKVEYTGASNKVCIICSEHGEFWQTVSNHLKGQCGCKQCRGKSKDFEVIRTFEDFKKQAEKKYGNKFDFSKVEWKGSREKICIICPEHGEFWTLPRQFLLNKTGCPKCMHGLRYTQEEFIEACKKNHTIQYDYSKTVYTGSINKIIVTCPKHGDFQMMASTFKACSNCPECCIDNLKLTTEEFIARAKAIHGNRYDYSKTKYVNSYTKITITCPKHGDFECLPGNHLKGCDCFLCALENKVPSKGEIFVEQYLMQNKIPYRKQYKLTVPEIARKSKLIIVDFFVKYKNKQYFIEYNGKQHYEYIPYFFPSQEDFQNQLRRDNILREFCETYKDRIRLIEIKYNKSEQEVIDLLNSELGI